MKSMSIFFFFDWGFNINLKYLPDLALLTFFFILWSFFFLALVERIHKSKEVVVRGNTWNYKLENDKGDAHESTSVRKGIWHGNHLSLGDFILVVHLDVYWNKWRFRSVLVWQFLHCIMVHSSFHKGAIGGPTKEWRIVHLYLVLAQQNLIVVTRVEHRSQLI